MKSRGRMVLDHCKFESSLVLQHGRLVYTRALSDSSKDYVKTARKRIKSS
jgi:hypothetical protein